MTQKHQDYYKLFTTKGEFVGEADYDPDCSNDGLPEFAFNGNHVYFKVYADTGNVEWVPGMGPAPCWNSNIYTDADIWESFSAWFKSNY